MIPRMMEPAQYNGPAEVLNLAKELEFRRTEAADYVVGGMDIDCVVLRDGGEFGGALPAARVGLAWNQSGIDGAPAKALPLTRWAETQLAEACGIPLRYWDKMLDAGKDGLLVQNVNEWLPDLSDRRLRTYPDQVRAVVSNRFRALDNFDVLVAAVQALQGSSAEVMRVDVTESRLWMRLLDRSPDAHLPMADGSSALPGVILRNSEVGHGALLVRPFLYRQVCKNGLVLDTALREVHLGGRLDPGLISAETIGLEGEVTYRAVGDIIRTVFSDREKFADYVASLNESMGVRILEPPRLVEDMTVRRQITKEEADSILSVLASDPTILPQHRGTEYAFKQAISAVGRDTTDPDRAVELEMLAARIRVEDLAGGAVTA
ncbi:MAG TPA: hypothetical protein PKJ51_07360 [Methanothrix sp.]|nr:hypothetical protein [Methanothrix sp.]